jgi:hypothetical protein
MSPERFADGMSSECLRVPVVDDNIDLVDAHGHFAAWVACAAPTLVRKDGRVEQWLPETSAGYTGLPDRILP